MSNNKRWFIKINSDSLDECEKVVKALSTLSGEHPYIVFNNDAMEITEVDMDNVKIESEEWEVVKKKK